jgi:hypothetical protein
MQNEQSVTEQITDFLLDNKRRAIISINAIEKQAGLPKGALNNYLGGKVPTLSPRHHSAIIEVIQYIGFRLDS